MSDQEQPRCVFARLDTLCGCTRFLPLQSSSEDAAPDPINIPVVTRSGILERVFRRDLDAVGDHCDGQWKVGDVLVLAYREDA